MLPEVNSTFWLKVLDDSCGEQRVLLLYGWLKVGHLYRNTNTEGPKKCLTHAHHRAFHPVHLPLGSSFSQKGLSYNYDMC